MLEVIFLTSNNVKLAHARFLCRDYTISISKQKHYGVSYEEPRILDRFQLLQASIRDAYRRISKYSNNEHFFFIEDTSVVINALSKEREVPGVDIKYWMKENSFESLDKLLKENGNDRSVEVRSDIVLGIPHSLQLFLGEKGRYKFFSSSTKGNIVDKEIDFSTQPFYAWLDNKTFNKWFIPEGCDTVVSLLPIDEAEKHDFRKGAFDQMLAFLKNFNLIENKTSEQQEVINNSMPNQINLFTPPYLYIICGFTCAGKTTLADYITDNYNYFHFEASDYMYLSYYRSHGTNTSVSIGDFAEKVLQDYPRIVVDQIIDELENIGNIPTVITGFRSPDEIESFKKLYRGESKIQEIFVETESEIRFNRCIKRGRFDHYNDPKLFIKNDELQERMGLSKIKQQNADCVISNNGTFEEYFKQFEKIFGDNLAITKNPLPLELKFLNETRGLEDEIILSLFNEVKTESYFTTTKIANLINQRFYDGKTIKSKNNVSRYFNQYFYPYYEIKQINGKRTYHLSNTGIGYAKWLLRKYKK